MTVSEMDTLLAQQLSDADGDIWTQATHRLPTLNAAQDEIIPLILQYGEKYSHVFDVLTELQTIHENVSVGATGYDLDSVSGARRFIRNGYILSSVTINNETRYPVKFELSKLGMTSNRFQKGTDRSPKCYIFQNKFFVLVDVGSYPVTTNIYYIGEPYTLVASGATSNGQDTTVATPEYNIVVQHVVIKLAMVKCLFMRADNKDFNRIQLLQTEIYERDIPSLAKGAKNEPQTRTAGQFSRDNQEIAQEVIERIRENA